MIQLRVISLFAGIGGFDLGFERAGMKIVAHVEKHPQCRKLLAAKWPDAIALDDVCTAGKHNLPPCDVICGGFPCQDVSIAGKRAGLKTEAGITRSGLFYQLTRIADELKPALIVWENVPGLLSSDNGRDFARVLIELGRIGYGGAWTTVDAQYYGVAQSRRRVFGVFARRDIGAERCAEILSLKEGLRGHPAPCRKTGQVAPAIPASGAGTSRTGNERTETGSGRTPQQAELSRCLNAGGMGRQDYETETLIPVSGGGFDVVAFQQNASGELRTKDTAYTLNQNSNASGRNTGMVQFSGVRRLTPTECERLQGFPDGWTAGFADGPRYRMLGNAVCVPCAEWIGKRIVKELGRIQDGK